MRNLPPNKSILNNPMNESGLDKVHKEKKNTNAYEKTITVLC